MKKKDTILVVDDTQKNVEILVELLSDYDVVVARDGQTAINILLEDSSIDLILLDIMMPDMDGFEVCQKIKQNIQINKIPIIFLSAKSDDESLQKGFDIGAVDYIIKPFKPIELFSRVKLHIQLMQHEKESMELNKAKALNELIRNISHQWRQPLSVISTAASGCKIQKELNILSDQTLNNSFDAIIKNVEYLSATIENFQNLVANSEYKSLFNLKELIEENIHLFFYKNEKILVDIDIQNNIEIIGVKNQLLQVLLPILNNAKEILEFTKQKSPMIFVKAKKENNVAIINIYDNAGGVSNEIVDKIFDPYFTTKHESLGTGLGLYSVRNIIINTFYGDIKVSNIHYEYENSFYEGANFEIKIPIN